MRTPLAWCNVTHNKARTAASVSGVCFAILLIYMQLGFYDSCFRSSTMIFDQLDFDIALIAPQYVQLRFAGGIPRQRLAQAKRVPGVADAVPCHVGTSLWRNPETRLHSEILVLGVDPEQPPFRPSALADNVHQLKKMDTALMDVKAPKRRYGTVQAGIVTELGNRRIEVVGTYAHGSGFISNAALVVGEKTYAQLFDGDPLKEVTLGLVKLQPGFDEETVVHDLQQLLPEDVQVLRRRELEAHEQRFYVRIKPLGIMFSSGVLLALVIGAVILYQILASDIMNRLRQYATLKAVGFSNAFVNRLVLEQACILTLLGYVPATVLAEGLFALTRWQVNLPMILTVPRAVLVLVLSLAMCSMAGLLASRKVSRADPVDLF